MPTKSFGIIKPTYITTFPVLTFIFGVNHTYLGLMSAISFMHCSAICSYPEYMKILLKEKTSLEELFAEIEIDTLRDELRKAQFSPEKIPIKIKRLIAMLDYPEKLMKMVEKAVASS